MTRRSSNEDDATITDPPPPTAPINLTANGGDEPGGAGLDRQRQQRDRLQDRAQAAGRSRHQLRPGGDDRTPTSSPSPTPGARGAYTYRVRATNAVGDSGLLQQRRRHRHRPAASGRAQRPDRQRRQRPGGRWPGRTTPTTRPASRSSASWPRIPTPASPRWARRRPTPPASPTRSVPAGDYTYRVRATNAVGDSAYSNTADATVTAPSGPTAPSNLNVDHRHRQLGHR